MSISRSCQLMVVRTLARLHGRVTLADAAPGNIEILRHVGRWKFPRRFCAGS